MGQCLLCDSCDPRLCLCSQPSGPPRAHLSLEPPIGFTDRSPLQQLGPPVCWVALDPAIGRLATCPLCRHVTWILVKRWLHGGVGR